MSLKPCDHLVRFILLWLVVSGLPLTSFAGDTPLKLAPTAGVIDLDRSVVVTLPRMQPDLVATGFRTSDGKSGWAIRIPGGRPIATPAYADGMIFVGGGYGSHEFYAFDADHGKIVWKINTKDDGPTAAVVEGGYVAFNTESCTVVVVDEKTGKVVWQEWLGDPLMSQPAIAKGKLFMAYPSDGRNGGKPGHRLLAADLKTGTHVWEQEISGDVVSAPVVSGDTVYLTCFDGSMFAINANNGKIVWKKSQSGTSAPLVVGSEVVITSREQQGKQAYEGMARLDAVQGRQKNGTLIAKEKAEYLARENSGGVALNKSVQASLDSSVGFAAAPPSANIKAATENVGVSTVAAGWAYQGSRPGYRDGRVMNAQGNIVNSIRAKDSESTWKMEAKSKLVRSNMQVFSPPALGAKNLYLTSSFGHIVKVSQKDGTVRFSYMFGVPIAFQPVLARGNVYAGTTNGLLICLETGDTDADKWYAWGGNAQHNQE